MYKTKILIIGCALIALNAVAMTLLFVIPGNTTVDTATEATVATTGVVSEGVENNPASAPPTSSIDNVEDNLPFHPQQGDGEVLGNQPPVATSSLERPYVPVSSIHSDASIRIPIREASTVITAMQAHDTASNEFSFSGKEYPGIGFFVQEINGTREGGGYYWILYVNGKTADLGASRQQVVPGDIVEWRYEKGFNGS